MYVITHVIFKCTVNQSGKVEINCFHSIELDWEGSFFRMWRVQMNQCCLLFVKCVNFNRIVSLAETLFCQKFSNQLYTQQRLVKMPALALKDVLLAGGSLASKLADSLLCLHGAAAAASMWGCWQVPPASSSPTMILVAVSSAFLLLCHFQIYIISYSITYQTTSTPFLCRQAQ